MRSLFAALFMLAAAPSVVAVTPRPAPIPLGSVLGVAGFGAPLRPIQGFTPLQGLSPAGDPAPQCRNVCVQNRAVCGDDAECGEQWRQCVFGCRRAAR